MAYILGSVSHGVLFAGFSYLFCCSILHDWHPYGVLQWRPMLDAGGGGGGCVGIWIIFYVSVVSWRT